MVTSNSQRNGVSMQAASGSNATGQNQTVANSTGLATRTNATKMSDWVCAPRIMPVNLPAPLGPNLFILGEPVLHRYYTVYDWKTKEIGFGLSATKRNKVKVAAQKELEQVAPPEHVAPEP